MNHFFKLLDQSPRERCLSSQSNEIESPRLDTLGAKAKKFFSRMNMFTKVREFRENVSDVSTDSKIKESPSRKFRNEIKISRNWSSDVFQNNILGSTSYHSANCESYDCNAKSWQIERENYNPPKSTDMYQADINLSCEKELDWTSSFLSSKEFCAAEDENSREIPTCNDQSRIKEIALKKFERDSKSNTSFKSLKNNFDQECKNSKEQYDEQSKIPDTEVNASFVSLENVILDGIVEEKIKEGNKDMLGEDNFAVLDMDLTCNISTAHCIENHVNSCEIEMKASNNDNAKNIEVSSLSYKSCSSENMSENLELLPSMDELNSLNVGILINDSLEKIEDTNTDIKERITDNDLYEVSIEDPRTALLDNKDYARVVESYSPRLYENNMENIQEMEISLKESLTVGNSSENASSFFEYLNVSNIECPGDKNSLETKEMISRKNNNKSSSSKRFQKTSSPKSISNDSGYQNHSLALSTERLSLDASLCDSRDVSYEPKMKNLENTSDLYLTAMEDWLKNDNASKDSLVMETSDLLIQ